MTEPKHEYADKYVYQVSDIPAEPHWAILQNAYLYIAADERSKTHPGHGYPARTENYISYEIYLTEEKWKRQIQYRELDSQKKPYLAIKSIPARITSVVSVTVDEM